MAPGQLWLYRSEDEKEMIAIVVICAFEGPLSIRSDGKRYWRCLELNRTHPERIFSFLWTGPSDRALLGTYERLA